MLFNPTFSILRLEKEEVPSHDIKHESRIIHRATSIDCVTSRQHGRMEKDPVIGLIFATMTEAKPFVQGMALEKTEDAPFSVFEKGRAEDGLFSVSEKVRMVLIISGIGKANAAMATFHCCWTFHPDLIANLGAAGSTNESFALGDILHVTEAIEYDRPDLESNQPHVHLPHVLEGFPLAKVATQDTPVIDPHKRQEIAPIAGLVDMEAASIIQACGKFQTKCVIFKFVSDTPYHTQGDEIVMNIKQYRTHFFDFFKKAVITRLMP